MGDSEYNDGILGNDLVRELGANVYQMSYGGHRVAIPQNYSNTTGVNAVSHSWFYQEAYRTMVLSQVQMDAAILTFSSNDGGGDSDWNGSIDESKITAVEANYPTLTDILNDDQTDHDAKLALFDGMTDSQKFSIFGFVGCYCAYIKQILQAYPRCRVLVCSVPISCGGYLTGTAVPDPSSVSEETIGEWAEGKNADVARANLEPGQLNKDSQIRAIANRYHSQFVDLRNECGLTYENFIYHCADGVHWYKDIDHNISHAILRALNW